jgi:rod shape-determining protein MreD
VSIQESRGGMWVIACSFAVAFMLAVMPLPHTILWARPEWVTLVLIYWVIALPQRIGILVSFLVGLLLDSLEGAALGQNALSLSVVAYLSLLLYQRLRVFNMWQQAAVIFVMVGINQLVGQWLQNISGLNTGNPLFLMPVAISALLWPGVMTLLRHLRRRYQVR